MGPLVMEAFCASGLAYPRTAVVVDFIEGRMSLLASFLTMFPPSILGFSTGRP